MVGCGISVGYLHLQIPEFEKIYIIIQFHVEVTFGIRGVTGRRGRASQESQESQVSVCQVQQYTTTTDHHLLAHHAAKGIDYGGHKES